MPRKSTKGGGGRKSAKLLKGSVKRVQSIKTLMQSAANEAEATAEAGRLRRMSKLFVDERIYKGLFGQGFVSPFGRLLERKLPRGPCVFPAWKAPPPAAAKVSRPRRRATMFGTVVCMDEVEAAPNTAYMWSRKRAIVLGNSTRAPFQKNCNRRASIAKLQRNDSMASLAISAGGRASTVEYGRTFPYDVEETMRRRYDPTGSGRQKSEKPWLYTTKNLLKREALRFVPSLLEWLNIIWEVADADKSGTMDKEEYLAMYKHMCIAQGHCDKLGNLSEEMQQHGLNDWKIDRQGHTHLNKTRFYESWFQLADQHTEEIHVLEYTHFLKDLCENMTIKDPRARKLRWRTFEEMLDRDRRASMAAGMFIKDVASDREYQRNKANRAAMALQRAYRRFMECRGACRAAAALRMRAELDTADQPAASFSNKRSSFDANRSIPPKARPNHTLPTANASPALGTAFDDDFKSAVEKAGDSLSQTIHHASTEVPPKATGVSALSDWAQLAETPLPIDDSISTIQTHEDLKERSVQLIQRTWRKWRDTAEPIDGNGSFMEDANSWMAEATRRVAARTIQSFGVRYVLGPSRRKEMRAKRLRELSTLACTHDLKSQSTARPTSTVNGPGDMEGLAVLGAEYGHTQRCPLCNALTACVCPSWTFEAKRMKPEKKHRIRDAVRSTTTMPPQSGPTHASIKQLKQRYSFGASPWVPEYAAEYEIERFGESRGTPFDEAYDRLYNGETQAHDYAASTNHLNRRRTVQIQRDAYAREVYAATQTQRSINTARNPFALGSTVNMRTMGPQNTWENSLTKGSSSLKLTRGSGSKENEVSLRSASKSKRRERGRTRAKKVVRSAVNDEKSAQSQARPFTAPDIPHHPRDGHLQTALATVHVHMRKSLNLSRGRTSPPVGLAVARPPSKLTNRMRDEVRDASLQHQDHAPTSVPRAPSPAGSAELQAAPERPEFHSDEYLDYYKEHEGRSKSSMEPDFYGLGEAGREQDSPVSFRDCERGDESPVSAGRDTRDARCSEQARASPISFGIGDGRGRSTSSAILGRGGSSGGGGRSSPVQFVYSDSDNDNDNERDGEDTLRRAVHGSRGGNDGCEREHGPETDNTMHPGISLDFSLGGSSGEGDRDRDEGNNATGAQATLRQLTKGRASLYSLPAQDTTPPSACVTALGIAHVDFHWSSRADSPQRFRSQRSTIVSKTSISAKALIKQEELEIEKKVIVDASDLVPVNVDHRPVLSTRSRGEGLLGAEKEGIGDYRRLEWDQHPLTTIAAH